MKFFQFFNPFRKPSAAQLKQEQLEEAERQLLTQESLAAYHQKMAEYYRESITRLTF